MDQFVQIDQMNPVLAAARTYVVPAMKDGQAFQISVGQILDLLIGSAPGSLDTLAELADALNDDANFAATVTAALAAKVSLTGVQTLTDKTMTAPVLNAPIITAPQGEFLRGRLNGLTFANDAAGDVTNDFIIASGFAASDGATPVLMALAGSITKRTDAAWVAGTGNGCWLDGGSIANGTHYVFLIGGAAVPTDIGVSASANPTLPSGYTWKRRITWLIREAGALARVFQYGDEFRFKLASTDVTATNPGTSAVTRTLRVPLGEGVFAICNAVVRNSTTAGSWAAYISDLATDDVAPALTGPLSNTGTGGIDNRFGQEISVRTNASGQVRSRLSTSDGNTTLYIATLGWIDNRGRA